MRLTDLSIRKLAAPERGQRTHFDDGLPGFGLRISQGGTKSFVVMYGARRRLKTIGRYPAMKLADARREAKRLQAEISDPDVGFQPVMERVSFADARERFLADCARRTRPRTVGDYRRLLERHFSFDKPLAEIARREVMQVVSGLAPTPSEQAHAYVALRTMLNWCRRQGLIDASPLPRMRMATSARDRVLTDAELVAVYRAAQAAPWPFGPIVQLLILTGQRRGEIGALQWDWIDLEARLIAFPASITKNKRAHALPIGETAARLIAGLPQLGPHLFPARTEQGTVFNGWGKAKARLDAGLEAVAPYTLHDLRRSFSSTHARLGTPIHVTEKLLNHVSGTLSGVAAIYNRHSYAEEMREAMEAYEAHLASLANDFAYERSDNS